MSSVENKRTYKKAPLVIKKFLNSKTKQQLIKTTKNLIKKKKQENMNMDKKIKQQNKQENKLKKLEYKKSEHQKAKNIVKSLSLYEKKDMIIFKYKKLLSLCSNVDLAIEELMKISNNTIYVDMIKKGFYNHIKREEIYTRIEV